MQRINMKLHQTIKRDKFEYVMALSGRAVEGNGAEVPFDYHDFRVVGRVEANRKATSKLFAKLLNELNAAYRNQNVVVNWV